MSTVHGADGLINYDNISVQESLEIWTYFSFFCKQLLSEVSIYYEITKSKVRSTVLHVRWSHDVNTLL